MTEKSNWYDTYFDSLPVEELHCVRGKADEEKIQTYCRIIRCPNLIEGRALEAKPREMFGNKHFLQEGLNIFSEIE